MQEEVKLPDPPIQGVDCLLLRLALSHCYGAELKLLHSDLFLIFSHYKANYCDLALSVLLAITVPVEFGQC